MCSEFVTQEEKGVLITQLLWKAEGLSGEAAESRRAGTCRNMVSSTFIKLSSEIII